MEIKQAIRIIMIACFLTPFVALQAWGVPWLRIDPTYNPLREHPRFRGLVARD